MDTRTRLEELVFQFLETPEVDQDSFLERVCEEHSELADRLRARIDSIRRYGLEGQGNEVDTLLEPGKMIGDYRLVKLLGSGGMGLVWEAQQISLGNRRVALKFIRPEYLLFPKAKQRFHREAMLSSRLSHSGICSVYEIGEFHATPFLAMQFIDGESLADKIGVAKKAQSTTAHLGGGEKGSGSSQGAIAAALELFESAAMALHAAHEAGVLHRDIKPGNMMITDEGDPILLDFGLAKAEEEEEGAQLTMTGDTLGTLSYMTPEQVSGRGHRADRRADIYSLAASLHETITLHCPFEASSRNDLQRKIVEDPLLNPKRHNSSIPKDLVTVLECALAKTPDERYDSAQAFAEDLGRVRRHEPILAERKSLLARGGLWARRNPLVASLLTILSIGLVSSLILLYQLNIQNAANRSSSLVVASQFAQDSNQKKALKLAVSAVKSNSTPASERRLYNAIRGHRELARVGLDGEGRRVRAYVGGFIAATAQGSLYDVDVDGEVRRKASIEGSIKDISLWPAGDRQIYVLTGEGKVYLWNGTDPDPVLLRLGSEGWKFMSTSNDGALMLFGGTERAIVIDRRSQKILHVYPEEVGLTAGCFTLDSACILLGSDKGSLIMRELKAGQRTVLFQVPKNKKVSFRELAHIPLAGSKGALVAISQQLTGQILVVDIASTKVEFMTGHLGILLDLEIAPERKFFVTADNSKSLAIWSAKKKIRLRSTGNGHEGDVLTLGYSPTGRLFASGSSDGTVRIWDIRGVQRARLTGHANDVYGIAFAPDESVLASVGLDRSLRIWSVEEPKPAFAHPWQATSFFAEISADGKSAYVTCTDQAIWRHDLDGESLHFGGSEYRGGSGGQVALDEENDLLVRGRVAHRQRFSELVVWSQISKTPRLASRKGHLGTKISSVIFFKDHKRLLVVLKGGRSVPPGFQIWRLDGHELSLVSDHPTAKVNVNRGLNAGIILPGEERVALACKDGTVLIADLEGRVQETLMHRENIPVRRVVTNADGSMLASAGRDGWISVFRRRAGNYVRVQHWEGHSSRIWSLRYTDKGLLTAAGDSRVCIWSPEGELVREFQSKGEEFHDAWIPKDQDFVMVVSSDASIRRFYLDVDDAIDQAGKLLATDDR